MRVVFVNPHLETGGIRQSLLFLYSTIKSSDLNLDIELQLLKYDEHYILQYKELQGIKVLPRLRGMDVYMHTLRQQKGIVDKLLKVIFIALTRMIGRKNTVTFIIGCSRKLCGYDVAISYANNIYTEQVQGFFGGCEEYVLKRVGAKKKIAWIHNEPGRLGFTSEICERQYKDFNIVVNVSYACKALFDNIAPSHINKSMVVYNFFDYHHIEQLSRKMTSDVFDKDMFNIVTVARMNNQQKRIDRIIECCHMLNNKALKPFCWHIIGDGPDLASNKAMAQSNGLADVILFHGSKQNPYPYMAKADLFVLSSDYEAYPMVINEALSLGTPVICTRFPAAKEMVKNGQNGFIVDFSSESIYETVYHLMSESNQLEQFKTYALQHKPNNTVSMEQFKDAIAQIG